jgi:hypothetical protein
MNTPKQWAQTYREYAGFDTEEMRQRARDAGCEEDDIDLWLYIHYGNDQSRELSPLLWLYQKREKRLREQKDNPK